MILIVKNMKITKKVQNKKKQKKTLTLTITEVKNGKKLYRYTFMIVYNGIIQY